MRPTPEQIEQAKTQHGEKNVALIEAAEYDVAVIVKRPDRARYKMFRAAINDESKKPDAPENLLLGCLVFPARAEFEALLNELPGLADSLSGELLTFAGLSKKAEKKTV